MATLREKMAIGKSRQELKPRGWKPWPWRYFGEYADTVSAFFGLCIIVPIAPLMAVLIGTGEISWALLTRAYKRLPVIDQIREKIRSTSEGVAKVIMRDPRNAPYLPPIVWLSVWGPLLFVLAIWHQINYGFSWVFFFVYHFLRIGPRFRFFAYLHVLVHKEGHDHLGFFRSWYGRLGLNQICQWWIGPFYGQVPNSYAVAHNKIHHRFDNGLDDVHTNLDLDRSRPWSLVVYVPRFALYWSGISPLWFFVTRREWALAAKLVIGMAYYYGVFMGATMAWDWSFCLAFVVFPHLEDFVFFGGISYLWHSWVAPHDPDNQYVNSVTIINGKDNIWNEDYHVVHHTSPVTHWTDYPKHYEEHKSEYAKIHATIFTDTEEGELLFWMLSKNWDKMAEHYVDLEGKMTKEEKKKLILERLSYTLV